MIKKYLVLDLELKLPKDLEVLPLEVKPQDCVGEWIPVIKLSELDESLEPFQKSFTKIIDDFFGFIAAWDDKKNEFIITEDEQKMFKEAILKELEKLRNMINSEFTEQELKDIKLAKKQFKQGNYHTQEQIEKMINLWN